MGRVVIVLIPLVFTVWGLVDCAQATGASVRAMPKWVWLLVVLLLPIVGAVLWAVFGRPRRVSDSVGPGGRRPSSPTAPDDDPAFLRRLDEDRWLEERRRRRDPGPSDS